MWIKLFICLWVCLSCDLWDRLPGSIHGGYHYIKVIYQHYIKVVSHMTSGCINGLNSSPVPICTAFVVWLYSFSHQGTNCIFLLFEIEFNHVMYFVQWMWAEMMLAGVWKRTCPLCLSFLCLFHLYEKDMPKFVCCSQKEDKKHKYGVLESQTQSRSADSQIAQPRFVIYQLTQVLTRNNIGYCFKPLGFGFFLILQ